jgi:uncharacterized protein
VQVLNQPKILQVKNQNRGNMPEIKFYNTHTHIFNFKCVPTGFLSNYLPRAFANILGTLLRTAPVAWVLSRILRTIPVDMVKKYRSFLAVGIRSTPQNVFEDMLTAYDNRTDVGIVVLPMNFDYMGGGDAPAKYATQLKLTEDVKRKYPNQCFPFLAIDPRMGTSAGILEFVKNNFEPFRGYHGIKLYPSLGFYPFDKRLESMYQYAQENNIPIMTHCTRFGAFYAGKTMPKELLDFSNSFNPTPETAARHKQDFYASLNTLKANEACDAFLDPVNYYDVLKKFPKLKLCFAHYGGDREIVKFKDSTIPQQGILATGYNNKTSWYFIIKNFMQLFENVYTDISYTLYDTKPSDGVTQIVKADLSVISQPGVAKKETGNKILFGTDYFMTLQEKEEKLLYTDFRNDLNDPVLWQNLVYYNNKEFLSSNFYTMP